MNYVNKDSTELLVLILHYGDSKYEFSEFRITIFSKPFFEKYTVLPDATTFKTYKGLSLGVNVKEFNKILGNNLKEETEGDTIKFSYYLTGEYPDYENSPFLKFYNMPIYYGKYTFKDNHLIKIEFGFEYP